MNYSQKYLKNIKPNLKKPYLPTFLLFLVIVVGTIGFYIIWHEQYAINLIDALYMTIITITTVGFEEVHPLSNSKRIFTIIISVIGIASMFYVFTSVMENLFILQLSQYRKKRKMMKKIDELKNHIIVVGYGRVGQLVTRELIDTKQEFVVVDNDFVEDDIFNLKNQISTITGDGTDDEILLLAGIKRARAMIIATANPATTVFVTLSAKVLNPNIFIVARSDDFTEIEKLERAGADRVVNPYSIGGQRLVALTINPNVVDFLTTNFLRQTNIKMETLILPEDSPFCGKSLMEIDVRKKAGATILAVIRDDKSTLNPKPNFLLRPGDNILIFGTKENIDALEELALKS